MATELLQPRDLACGTLSQSSCVILTSPTDCSDDSCRDTFSGSMNTALCEVTSDMQRSRKTLTYLLTTQHTHIRLTALCQVLPRWASTRKVKRIWILLKQETVSGSGISWAICKSALCSRQITMPANPPLSFLQVGCPSSRPTNSVKALKAPTYLLTTQTGRKAWQVSPGTWLQQRRRRCVSGPLSSQPRVQTVAMTQSTCSADSALSDMCLANCQVFPAKYRPNGRVGKFFFHQVKKTFFSTKKLSWKKNFCRQKTSFFHQLHGKKSQTKLFFQTENEVKNIVLKCDCC